MAIKDDTGSVIPDGGGEWQGGTGSLAQRITGGMRVQCPRRVLLVAIAMVTCAGCATPPAEVGRTADTERMDAQDRAAASGGGAAEGGSAEGGSAAGGEAAAGRTQGGAAMGHDAGGQPDVSAADPLHECQQVTGLALGPGGALVSGELAASAAFTQCLPSWNVDSTEPFTVELRTRPQGSSLWTPWLLIGDWGIAQRSEEVVTACDEARVAVDVLEASTPLDRAQLRFTPGGASPLSPEAVRAFVIFTDERLLEQRVAAASAEPWPLPVELSVPARSQRAAGEDIGHRICSPTSVAMVAAYHGRRVPTRTMAATVLDPHFDIYGNWNRAVQGAFSHGVPGRLVRLSSWASVAEYLAAGRPLVASIRAAPGELRGAPYEKTAGHLLVITGLGLGGVVYVNDPAAAWPGVVPRRYMRADMEQVWFRNGGVAYALEAPKALRGETL